MVTDDGEEVVCHDLNWAVLCEEWLKVQAFQREGNVGADFGRKHQFMSKSFKMDAQNLKECNSTSKLIIKKDYKWLKSTIKFYFINKKIQKL